MITRNKTYPFLSTVARMRSRSDTNEGWQKASFFAFSVWLLVTALFLYWFAIADRYVIFLYNHHGAIPFDAQTVSRYWMTGWVASGAVGLVYGTINWLASRIWTRFSPPAWGRVWLIIAIPIAVTLLAITTQCNTPTLPLNIAIYCVVATLSGLALALSLASWVVRHSIRLIFLLVAALGLLPGLLVARVITLSQMRLGDNEMSVGIVVGSCVLGTVWLLCVTRLSLIIDPKPISGTQLLMAGLAWSYLILPLIHYVALTPTNLHYISVSANFVPEDAPAMLLTAGFTAVSVLLNTTASQYWYALAKDTTQSVKWIAQSVALSDLDQLRLGSAAAVATAMFCIWLGTTSAHVDASRLYEIDLFPDHYHLDHVLFDRFVFLPIVTK